MSASELRWAISPHDARPHAFNAEQLDRKAQRGHAQAVCGHPVVACPIEVNTPVGEVCAVFDGREAEDWMVLLAGLGGPAA